jgi:hypothetical protein
MGSLSLLVEKEYAVFFIGNRCFLLSPSILFYRKIAYVYLLCTYFLLSPYGALFSQLNLSQFVRGKTHNHIHMITLLKMESMVNMLGALEDETSQLSRATTEATQICQPQVFCSYNTNMKPTYREFAKWQIVS